MKYKIGIKSYSDFQKMLNQWTTTNIKFKILKLEFDTKKQEIHYLLQTFQTH